VDLPKPSTKGSKVTIIPEATRRNVQPVDFINVSSLLSDEEKTVRDKVRSFVDEAVIPTAAEYWDKAEFLPFDLLAPLGELEIMGGSFEKEYGCARWSNVAYGFAIAELARGSGNLATFLHVQSGLAMAAIRSLGSEEQKQKWLPLMAKCERSAASASPNPTLEAIPAT
jgi:glutaryl-CoA dehydrogenase